MRKRNVRKELEIYPFYMYINGQLVRTQKPDRWNYDYQLHHFITTQWEQTHPTEFISVAHLQKLILLPTQMHIDLHSRISNFKEKYGIEIDELLFDWRKQMKLSAADARSLTDDNQVKVRIAAIEKAIKNAIEKGKYEIFISGALEKGAEDELKDAGFICEQQVNGWKIRW